MTLEDPEDAALRSRSVSGRTETIVLHAGGQYLGSEKAPVEAALGRRPGVLAVDANPVAQTATVTYDPAGTSVEELRGCLERAGFECAGCNLPSCLCDPLAEPGTPELRHDAAAVQRADDPMGHGMGGHSGHSMVQMATEMRNRFVLALVFTLAILAWSSVGKSLFGGQLATPFGLDRNVWELLLSLPVLYAGQMFFTGAVRALRQRTLDMMVLVATAVGISWLYSVLVTAGLSGEVFYDAGAMLATFVLLGHWFEMRARGGASDAIRALLDLAPPMALVLRDGEPVEVPTAEVAVGDVLLIRPGAKVPVDAEVIDGDSEVDESTVTGESLPVHKTVGDGLVGATINKNGTLRAPATAIGSDTALAQIVTLVQEAQNSKAPAQRLADRAAFWLVLVALSAGAITFLVWSVIVGRDVRYALLFAVTVIVIACPDALGLATPTAIMVGSGLGARRGILFKSAIALERISAVNTVVFDKTGTLTRGEPEVVAVETADGVEETELLRLVAAAERDSEHPLATAIVNAAAARGLHPPPANSFEAIPGEGAIATVDGRRLAVGNAKLLAREHVSLDGLSAAAERLAGQGRTTVQVGLDGRAAAVIAIADAVRDGSKHAVAQLHELQGAHRDADRRWPRDRRACRRRDRDRRGHRRGAPRRQGQHRRRAATTRPHGRDGRRRSQRRAGARPGRRRDRDRRRHRRRRRDRRPRADALRPTRCRDRDHDRPRHAPQDAPEPRLGDRLQQPRAADRRRHPRAAWRHAQPPGRRRQHVRLEPDRRRQRDRAQTPTAARLAARALGARSVGADVVDDVFGVVADPVDQRRASGVLTVHAEEVQPGGVGDPAPVARHTMVVKDRHVHPGVVGSIPGGPHHGVDLDRAPIREADRSSARINCAGEQLDRVVFGAPPEAVADEQLAALGAAAPGFKRGGDQPQPVAIPMQAPAENAAREMWEPAALRQVDAVVGGEVFGDLRARVRGSNDEHRGPRDLFWASVGVAVRLCHRCVQAVGERRDVRLLIGARGDDHRTGVKRL